MKPLSIAPPSVHKLNRARSAYANGLTVKTDRQAPSPAGITPNTANTRALGGSASVSTSGSAFVSAEADVAFADFAIEQAVIHGVSPQSIVLEITESRLMQNFSTVLHILSRLRLKRFRLSIDDFGTGNSSLAQLRDLPFDELKIDRSFTHNAGQDTRLRALFEGSLEMAKQLHMKVVAEGVEDERDWDFLTLANCDIAQGYFIARPLPVEALPVWYDEWRCRRDSSACVETTGAIRRPIDS